MFASAHSFGSRDDSSDRANDFNEQDWDMFKRIMMNVRDKKKNYMYIPKVTSFYRNREGKF